MSSLNNIEKYEIILVEIAKKVRSNNPVDKTTVRRIVELKKMTFREKEEKVLFDMISTLYKRLKMSEEPYLGIVKEILYPKPVEEKEPEKVALEESESKSKEMEKIELALKDFQDRCPTTTNEHLIFRDVASDFSLTLKEEQLLKEEIKKSKKTRSNQEIEKKYEEGDINAAFEELKEINPYILNTASIKRVADKHNVSPSSLKKLFQQKREEIIEERRRNQII